MSIIYIEFVQKKSVTVQIFYAPLEINPFSLRKVLLTVIKMIDVSMKSRNRCFVIYFTKIA